MKAWDTGSTILPSILERALESVSSLTKFSELDTN